MKMDKLLLALLVVSLVLFAVPARVHADDSGLNSTDSGDNEENDGTNDNGASDINDVDDEPKIDDEDVSAAKYNHGMEVRLLQLQKSVVKHIKVGNLIIEEIDNQNFDADTTKLEGYVEDMNDLNDKITAALAEEPVNVSVEQFVAWKHEAIKITFQFKAELYTILTPEQLKIIKDALKDKMDVKDEKELKVEQKLKGKVKEYNQEVALKMLEKFGGDNEQMRARIMAGNLSTKDLKVELRNEYKNLGEARKAQLKLKIREEKNNESREKFELEAKFRGLNRSEVVKIANDPSLTLEEKQAKIRVLIEEQKALNGNNGRGPEGNGKGNGNGTGRMCQNFPPPDFCDGSSVKKTGKIVSLGKDENGCNIWGCRE